MAQQLPTGPIFGVEAVIIAILFVAILMLIGYYAYKKRIGVSVYDFFLASRTLGYIVLALSLFAAQYSGNSFIGYAAKAYRSGFVYLVYPTFMLAILPILLIVAARLIPIATRRKLISPLDFIRERYYYGNNRGIANAIAVLSLIFLVWGTFVQFFEQAIAMGYLGEVFSGGLLPYTYMLVIFILGVIVFTVLGGFRGAALANALMGAIMLFGLISALWLVNVHYGGIGAAVEKLSKISPKLIMTPTSTETYAWWFSTIFLVGIGAALYIHILMHVMASRDPHTFKRTFLFTPYFYIFTATTLLIVGICGAAAFPGLGKFESERIVPIMVVNAAAKDPMAKVIGIIWLVAVLSATLSTAGTTITAISMTIVKDIYRTYINPNATERQAVLVGRIALILLALLAIPIVWNPRLTIWRWTELKFEGLIQVAPAILLGLYVPWINDKGVLAGMIIGALTAMSLTLSGHRYVYGIHAGMIGLIINLIVCLIVSKISIKPEEINAAKKLIGLE